MASFFDLISNLVPITGNPIADSILFALINIVTFAIAWYITGLIAELIGYDPNGMSLVHWIVRIALYLGLLFLFAGAVKLIRWFLSFEWWVYIIIALVMSLIAGGIVLLCILIKKKTKAKKASQS